MIAAGPYESIEFTSGPNSKWNEDWFYEHIKIVTQSIEDIVKSSIERAIKKSNRFQISNTYHLKD